MRKVALSCTVAIVFLTAPMPMLTGHTYSFIGTGIASAQDLTSDESLIVQLANMPDSQRQTALQQLLLRRPNVNIAVLVARVIIANPNAAAAITRDFITAYPGAAVQITKAAVAATPAMNRGLVAQAALQAAPPGTRGSVANAISVTITASHLDAVNAALNAAIDNALGTTGGNLTPNNEGDDFAGSVGGAGSPEGGGPSSGTTGGSSTSGGSTESGGTDSSESSSGNSSNDTADGKTVPGTSQQAQSENQDQTAEATPDETPVITPIITPIITPTIELEVPTSVSPT
ncbi:hypothetical protein [Martelella sp. HB161492]|uniref:hypothetical protein n=1 Tax=Martelella sp. HB161492 TaxID=2720726 RepID=UPI00158FB6D1|nr:hypothetical protein [Martelella sp. HB161492]